MYWFSHLIHMKTVVLYENLDMRVCLCFARALIICDERG